jgi:hypothetical protein
MTSRRRPNEREAAAHPQERSARPDVETYRAVLPSLMTLVSACYTCIRQHQNMRSVAVCASMAQGSLCAPGCATLEPSCDCARSSVSFLTNRRLCFAAGARTLPDGLGILLTLQKGVLRLTLVRFCPGAALGQPTIVCFGPEAQRPQVFSSPKPQPGHEQRAWPDPK